MTISSSQVDEFIRQKGLTPLLNDELWRLLLGEFAAVLGHQIYHRCWLVTQRMDSMARYCTRFPEDIPKPYRHIYCLEVTVPDDTARHRLESWLRLQSVTWRHSTSDAPDTGESFITGLQVFGFPPGSNAAANT